MSFLTYTYWPLLPCLHSSHKTASQPGKQAGTENGSDDDDRQSLSMLSTGADAAHAHVLLHFIPHMPFHEDIFILILEMKNLRCSGA